MRLGKLISGNDAIVPGYIHDDGLHTPATRHAAFIALRFPAPRRLMPDPEPDVATRLRRFRPSDQETGACTYVQDQMKIIAEEGFEIIGG